MTARRNLVLLVLVVTLLLVALAGTWLVWRTHEDRTAAAARQQVYGDVLAAATAHGTALVNLRYDDPATFRSARRSATGDLVDDYAPEGVVAAPLLRDRSVLVGEVTWAGVSEISGDTATALVATTGTVTSRSTGGEPSERRLRLRLRLQRVGDAWRTRDVELVA